MVEHWAQQLVALVSSREYGCARGVFVPLMFSTVLVVCTLPGASADTRVVLQTTSDWIYHGTTETFSQAAVGANVEWQGSSPLFVGVEAHQSVTPGMQQRHRAVMAYAGYAYRFSDQWHGSATFARRFFPGSFKPWNYNELKLELAHDRGWTFKLDYAADYYDHETEVFVGEAGFTGTWTNQRYWYFNAGATRFDARRFPDYEFARLGAGWSQSRLNLDLSYGWNSENNTPLFGVERIRSPQWLVQLSYQLR